ncbi:MAG: FAD-binding oxidoreductase, partial [Sphingomicrobium sp.]
MIDRRPAAIAFCEDTNDVVKALNFARENNLAFSVRCGGHGVSGNSVIDDGILIDLSAMCSVRVASEKRRAIVGGGAQLGDFDREAQAHGLAATAGVDPSTGVGGLTLGGGTGFLARKLGLTIDSLIGAQVVLADGSVVRASADEHPDLFWALRGGGGNFGIVTEFEFTLHPVGPEVMSLQVFYPLDAARDVLRFYRDFMADAPDEVGVYA